MPSRKAAPCPSARTPPRSRPRRSRSGTRTPTSPGWNVRSRVARFVDLLVEFEGLLVVGFNVVYVPPSGEVSNDGGVVGGGTFSDVAGEGRAGPEGRPEVGVARHRR